MPQRAVALGKQQVRKIENQTELRPSEVQLGLLSQWHSDNKTGFLCMNKKQPQVAACCLFRRETEAERRIVYDPEELGESKKERKTERRQRVQKNGEKERTTKKPSFRQANQI